ncbi:MAG: glycosyltransferase family 2 protein [Alphaproteobacteria bacterium]
MGGPIRLSVIIPVRNGAHFLARAVASVRGDAGPAVEIVVVDDRSTDDTRAIAEELARRDEGVIRIVAADKGCPAGARNIGIAAAGGELLTFLDVDDEWETGRTAALMRRLDGDPTLDVAYGRIKAWVADPEDPVWGKNSFSDQALPFPLVGAGIYRRAAFDRAGLFDETLFFGEDFDWFLRACEARLHLVIIDQVVLRYHLHASNITRERQKATFAMTTVMRRSLQRRRRNGVTEQMPPISDYYEKEKAR